MKQYQERIIEEKLELDDKATKLSEFIGNNPLFENIDSVEQERMKEQCEIMWQYSEILGQRIAAFSDSDRQELKNCSSNHTKPKEQFACSKNWKQIIEKSLPLFGRKYKDEYGAKYYFEGVLHGGDDYYYVMTGEESDQYLSCVGSIETHGFTLMEDHGFQLAEGEAE